MELIITLIALIFLAVIWVISIVFGLFKTLLQNSGVLGGTLLGAFLMKLWKDTDRKNLN